MNNNSLRYLSELTDGDSGVITRISGHGAFRKRITEMGFVKGKSVRVVRNAPLNDPVEYSIMGYNVSLRRAEASMIEVSAEERAVSPAAVFNGVIVDERNELPMAGRGTTINVALVGNPNSGKTTLFNHASGSHEKTGNYGGVTVEAKEATIKKHGYNIKITDLPGTYSITEYTPEELFVRKHILDTKPDIVINVVDGSNLERNLYLTTQLIDMNIRVIVALNMYDELEKKGVSLDHEALGRLTGIPFVPTIASSGYGIGDLADRIIRVYEEKDQISRHIHINYGQDIEEAVRSVQHELRKEKDVSAKISTRYVALKLLENDKATLKMISSLSQYEEIENLCRSWRELLERQYGEDAETIIVDARYGFISGALRETMITAKSRHDKGKRSIDDILTHKVLGFPIFLIFMWTMFQSTFTLGSYPMQWIDTGVAYLGSIAGTLIKAGPLHDLIVDGIIGGVGGVIIFLPNILILFFFISVMEDTGYMARISFLMDRIMHKMGLHGKSFIPLLMGFGCNVPAVMATRTLENRKDRIMTMLITPLMSCSARLPVYVLIISAFFTKYQGLILFSVYLTGIALAVIVSLLLKKIVFRKEDVPFVMELPPYRIPTARNTMRHMWFKASQYLRKMGSVILFASIIIWGLSYYPRNVESSAEYDRMISVAMADKTLTDTGRALAVSSLEREKAAEQQEKSFIGRLGHFIEPVIRPLGFDWKIGVCILTGLAAKEIVVSSMGILYQADPTGGMTDDSLAAQLQSQVHNSGKLAGSKVFTPPVAFGFMIFILIYFPCIAVIAAIRKEANIRWALFTMAYTTTLAWLAAFIAFQAGRLF